MVFRTQFQYAFLLRIWNRKFSASLTTVPSAKSDSPLADGGKVRRSGRCVSCHFRHRNFGVRLIVSVRINGTEYALRALYLSYSWAFLPNFPRQVVQIQNLPATILKSFTFVEIRCDFFGSERWTRKFYVGLLIMLVLLPSALRLHTD